jgi:hypothetical protein
MSKIKHTYNHICIKSYNTAFYTLSTLCLFATGLLFPNASKAQSIGTWTFNSILTGTPGPYNTISIADFSSGVPIHTFNGGTEYYGENGWPAGAINTSMYLQFSLTPAAGYQLDISTIVLTIRRSNTGTPAGSGPTSWSLRSSIDGFTNDVAAGSMTLNYANYTVTPGSSFLNLYTATTFRLYGYNATIGSGGNSRFVIDNLVVNGIGFLLPVTLSNLHAVVQDEKVNLSYTAYNTIENSHYSIERSTDGIHFTTIRSIEEINAVTEKQYAYTDDIQSFNGFSQLYYRVYMSGNSGNPVYSDIAVVKIKISQPQIKTFINNNLLYINGTFPGNDVCQADVYTLAGQAVWRTTFTVLAGYNAFTLPLNKYMPAAYVIHLSGSKGYSASIIAGK